MIRRVTSPHVPEPPPERWSNCLVSDGIAYVSGMTARGTDPACIVVIDPARDYWVGTRNLHSLFGIELDGAALRQVPVQLIVGGADTEQWEINYREGSANYMPGINDTGKTRLERLDRLRLNLEEHGVRVYQHVVPGVAHDVGKVFPHVEKFFAGVLDDCRAKCADT